MFHVQPIKPGQKKFLHSLQIFLTMKKNLGRQNIKYDMLVLKWYGYELKGKIFDTMLAHYVIEPDGKASMDMMSAKYLGYEPVAIEELIGKKGRTRATCVM